MRHAFDIAWIAIRELLYEKVFYLLISFAGVALALSLLLGQMTYGEQAKLTLDFMLAGIELSMVLFSIFMGISLFQRELNLGSVSMVLSKPISRSSFLMGKFLGQITVQFGVILAMALVTYVACIRFPSVSYPAVFQAIALIFFEVCVISSVTYAFSVNAGGITAALASFGIFAAGHFVGSAPQRAPAAAYQSTLSWKMITSFIPNLEIFNMKTLASYGVVLSMRELTLSFLYCVLCTTMFLIISIVTFNRKDIYT